MTLQHPIPIAAGEYRCPCDRRHSFYAYFPDGAGATIVDPARCGNCTACGRSVASILTGSACSHRRNWHPRCRRRT